MDARKTRLGERDALELAGDVDEIYAAKGKRVVHIDLKNDKLAETELAALLLGPTGDLRAPTVRVGRTLLVGFDEEMYRKLLVESKANRKK